MNPDELAAAPIEDYLCLALYRASRTVTGIYRDLLGPSGLTYPQYLVVRLLLQRGTQPIGEIARALSLDYATLSPLVKRLEAAGLIERHRRREDERVVDVALTAAGQALETGLADVPERLACAVGLEAADARVLSRLLTAINDTPATPPSS